MLFFTILLTVEKNPATILCMRAGRKITIVLFLPEVVNQFVELAESLYNKEYLGLKDAALNALGW